MSGICNDMPLFPVHFTILELRRLKKAKIQEHESCIVSVVLTARGIWSFGFEQLIPPSCFKTWLDPLICRTLNISNCLCHGSRRSLVCYMRITVTMISCIYQSISDEFFLLLNNMV
jgi:hypothetical protein